MGYFTEQAGDSSAPAYDAFAVTPNNSTEIFARSLYVGGAGDVSVQTAGGTTVTFVGVPAGSLLPIRVQKVRTTGTTATNIIGLR